jgi:hypothetical protein
MSAFFDKSQLFQQERKSLVCSVPKSGTYFLSEILEQLGITKTHFHISRNEFSDYRGGTLGEYRSYPEKFRREAAYEVPLRSLAQSHHAVGHLPCESDVRDTCRKLGIKVLFLYRDLRDCLISYMRFLASTGRDASATSDWMKAPEGPDRLRSFLRTYGWFIEAAQPIAKWHTDDEALPLQFEALAGDYGEEIQNNVVTSICQHLCISASDAKKKAAIEKSIYCKTITWSGNRTKRSLYWSDEVQRQFENLGGVELNRSLGYW